MNDIMTFELRVLIDKNKSTNEKKLDTEIQKMFSKNHQLKEVKFVQLKKSR